MSDLDCEQTREIAPIRPTKQSTEQMVEDTLELAATIGVENLGQGLKPIYCTVHYTALFRPVATDFQIRRFLESDAAPEFEEICNWAIIGDSAEVLRAVIHNACARFPAAIAPDSFEARKAFIDSVIEIESPGYLEWLQNLLDTTNIIRSEERLFEDMVKYTFRHFDSLCACLCLLGGWDGERY